jgi:hypothetical protein
LKKAKCFYEDLNLDWSMFEALFALDNAIIMNDKYSDAYELRADILFNKNFY